MNNSRNLILSEDNISEEDENILQVFTEEEMNKENQFINNLTKKTNNILKMRYDSNQIQKTPINEILVNVANKTIDIFKEISDIIITPPKMKYQDTFKWWKKYEIYFNKIMVVLRKDDRFIYFGIFLILVAFLLNFFNMSI